LTEPSSGRSLEGMEVSPTPMMVSFRGSFRSRGVRVECTSQPNLTLFIYYTLLPPPTTHFTCFPSFHGMPCSAILPWASTRSSVLIGTAPPASAPHIPRHVLHDAESGVVSPQLASGYSFGSGIRGYAMHRTCGTGRVFATRARRAPGERIQEMARAVWLGCAQMLFLLLCSGVEVR
jgi:hypothetical protein